MQNFRRSSKHFSDRFSWLCSVQLTTQLLSLNFTKKLTSFYSIATNVLCYSLKIHENDIYTHQSTLMFYFFTVITSIQVKQFTIHGSHYVLESYYRPAADKPILLITFNKQYAGSYMLSEGNDDFPITYCLISINIYGHPIGRNWRMCPRNTGRNYLRVHLKNTGRNQRRSFNRTSCRVATYGVTG